MRTKTAHIIRHRIPNDRISDMTEIVGIVTTGWEDADRIVDRFNERDSSPWRRDYWKEEIDIITIDDVARLTP